MSRLAVSALALAALVASCSGAGRNYWLYPAPHLEPEEEAVFVSYESHQIQNIDGEETQSRCWGYARQPQAYTQRDATCKLHLRPGPHSVSFLVTGVGSPRMTVDFNAEAGKMYSLDRSMCRSSTEGVSQTCRVEVVEIGTIGGQD